MRKYWAETAKERYVYILDNEIVGYAHIEGEELSSAAIKISRQGKGLGKNFVKILVNRLLEDGNNTPYLYCVVGNKARYLCDTLGSVEVTCNEYAKKTVK